MPYKDPAIRKEKHRGYSKKWYLSNRKKQISKSTERKERVRKLWIDYKAKQKCSHCGVQHPAVIDFHHVIKEGKRSVNKLIGERHNLNAAIREAEEKCIPLCSNCHRILHWNEHQIRRKRRLKKRLKKYDGDRRRHSGSSQGHTGMHERLHCNDRVQVPDTGGDSGSVLRRDPQTTG